MEKRNTRLSGLSIALIIVFALVAKSCLCDSSSSSSKSSEEEQPTREYYQEEADTTERVQDSPAEFESHNEAPEIDEVDEGIGEHNDVEDDYEF